MRERLVTCVTIVGEANPRGGPPFDAARGGDSACRLARYAGVTPEVMRKMFRLENLCVGPSYDRKEAAARALRVARRVYWGDVVVLLGARVAFAFGASRRPLFRAFADSSGAAYYRMPHPSGRCRWWNDPRNVARARRFLARLRREVVG